MSSKKKGGPVSTIGKANSAKNATKHGLTAKNASSNSEKMMVQNYVDELTHYYKPKSPLEKLQIERISICRAKLHRLYELEQIKIEQVKLQIEYSDLERISQMTSIKGIVKGMLGEMLIFGELVLPCNLSFQELEMIDQEISQLSNDIKSDEDIQTYLPQLTKYLLKKVSTSRESHPLFKKLQEDSNNLQIVFDRGESYFEYLTKKVLPLVQDFKIDEDSEEKSLEQEEFNRALDEYQLEVKERRRKESGIPSKPPKKIEIESFPNMKTMMSYLNNYRQLKQDALIAVEALEEIKQRKELDLQAVSLPFEEAERLMRYQTTLERRLSSAIGELIALQKQEI
jgi:hypothetical protein